MKVPNLTKQMKAENVNGKVYIDLELLLETMFEACNTGNQVATDSKDPVLGIMVTGMITLCKNLEEVLAAHQRAMGIPVTGTYPRQNL